MKKTALRIVAFALAPLVIFLILGLDHAYPDVQQTGLVGLSSSSTWLPAEPGLF